MEERLRDRVGRRLVDDHLVVRAVGPGERPREDLHAARVPEGPGPEVRDADAADLPEQERARRVVPAVPDEEIGRFEALAAPLAGVEAEVGDQAVLGGDAGEHDRLVAPGARAPDRLVRGLHEDSGMAVERGAHGPSRAHGREHALDHRLVARGARTARRVAVGERLGARVEALQPAVGDDVLDEVEELLRVLDRRLRLGRDLPGDAQPGAHQRQRTAVSSHPCLPDANRPRPGRSGRSARFRANIPEHPPRRAPWPGRTSRASSSTCPRTPG